MYRVIVVVFVLLGLTKVYLRYKDGIITVWRLLFWVAFWGGVAALSFHPPLSQYLDNRLGTERSVDMFFFLSILLIAYLLFSLYAQMQKLEQEVTKLVRTLALREMKEAGSGATGEDEAGDQ